LKLLITENFNNKLNDNTFANQYSVMSKKLLRKFDIKIQSLSNNEHKFRFEFNQDLFDFFSQENEIINTNGNCEVSLIKSDIMLDVKFTIDGQTDLICDRTLKKFTYSLNSDKKILFKFGEGDQELSEEMVVIDRNKSKINMGKFIYEFFILELPVKRLHPSVKNEDNIDNFVFTTKKTKDTDPRLDPLNKLK
tara:strand:- start:4396 stop:4974 length:579 start_codon:yes stop_codon:yes gene_type:complete